VTSSLDPSQRDTEGREAVHDAALARVDRLAWFLDNSIRLPGGFRLGFDSLVGLVPGLGDGLGLATSGYILLEAYRANVGNFVLLRMLLNVLIEAAVGLVPVVGDLFDMVWKSNTRNAELLKAHGSAPGATGQRSRWFIVFCFAAIFAIAGLVLWLGLVLLRLLLGWLW
jgi:hypothetical protein